ncbi:MAG: inositol monophosphatase family protein [bacterium]
MSLPSLRALLPAIHECAGLAMGYYRGEVSLGAELKGDQTLVTEADRRVEALLRRAIGELDPSARIVGEEGGVGRRGAGRLTFAIDPIDGTESFAARNPGWCIAVGVLDECARPIGGIVHVPTWDTTFLADLDPTEPAFSNHVPLAPLGADLAFTLGERSQLLIDSKAHLRYSFAGYPGRCRGFGSAALHVCLVAAQRGALAAQLLAPWVWDVAGAHAIAARVGVEIQTMAGASIDYAPMVEGAKCAADVLIGHPAVIDAIRPCFVALAR